MSEIRLVTSSDEHITNEKHNPGFRKDCYRDAILEKLDWQGKFARRFNATAFLRGGDLFHTKRPNATSMSDLVQLISLHKNYSCPVYSMIGNHDFPAGTCDPKSIEKQPLGVLLKSGVFQPLRDETFISGTLKVRVIGIDYTTDLAEDRIRELVQKKDDDVYTIAFIHALASMAPEEKIQSFFGEKILDYRDLIFPGCPDLFCFSHYHKDQGIVNHLGVKFINLGAVSRGALTFENLDRKPKISSIICNSQGISVEEHIVPHRDASEVFDLELKKKKESVRRDLDDFITQFRSDSSLSTENDIQSKIKKFQKSMEYPNDLKDAFAEIMEAAEAGLVDDL